MKYRAYASFDRDLRRLPPEHRRMFLSVLREHFLPAINAGSLTGKPPWPKRLRVHQLTGTTIYSLTWSFAAPDGRATFHMETREGDQPMLVWRRIGTHHIYTDP